MHTNRIERIAEKDNDYVISLRIFHSACDRVEWTTKYTIDLNAGELGLQAEPEFLGTLCRHLQPYSVTFCIPKNALRDRSPTDFKILLLKRLSNYGTSAEELVFASGVQEESEETSMRD